MLLSSRDLKSMPSNDLHGSSVLGIEVYRHHTIGSDEYIGGAKERIELLLAEGATGGQSSSLNDWVQT
jgi:hypothetical protein